MAPVSINPTPSVGTVVTFYSFKGGVGRSMALANISVLLARAGKRVLIVDWDLEAPGLARYFRDYTRNPPASPGGLLTLLYAARKSSDTNWQPYIEEIQLGNVSISFLGSGFDQPNYSNLLADFSWTDFFLREGGGHFLERVRNQWRDQFDFILIDSRTGVTDATGVCTILMPDVLTLVFVANYANVEGAKKAADAALAAREQLPYDRTRLLVFPLPSRFEGREEKNVSDEWQQIFADTFAPYYADWLPKRFSPLQAIEKTKIPNVPFFSFGEKLPVITHSVTDTDNPGYYYDIAARLLLGQFEDVEAVFDPASVAPNVDALTLPNIGAFLRRLREEPTYAVQLVREVEQQFPSDSFQLSNRLNDLATLFQDAGRYTDADSLFRRALLISERLLGAEHHDTLASVNNLAGLLEAKGDLAGAEPLYRRAMEAGERILGPEHPDTLTSVSNLAYLIKAKGDLAGAEPLQRRALEARERVLGPEHPDTLLSVNNLAVLLQAKGDLAGAEPLQRRALEARERVLGPEHPDTLLSVNNLASLLQAKGDLAGAEPFLRRALTEFEKTLGPEHPNTLTSVNNLASLLQAKGDLAGAELLQRRALEARERVLGPEHPHTYTSANNLAGLLEAKGDLANAEPLYRRALEGFRKNFGPEHPNTKIADKNWELCRERLKSFTEYVYSHEIYTGHPPYKGPLNTTVGELPPNGPTHVNSPSEEHRDT